MQKIYIKIADIIIEIFSADPDLPLGLDGDIAFFSCPQANPDLSMEASWTTLDENFGGRKIFDSGGAWQLYSRDDEYWFCCTSPFLGKVPYKAARIGHDFVSGKVFLHRPYFETSHSVYPLQYPLDELLVLNLLSRGRGAEIHACGIVDAEGDGYLFAGPSGAGKTTLAKLWVRERGVTILSDDRIILRKEGNRIWMHGTPWHGEAELASPSQALLKHIFFIRHGHKNSLEPKTGAGAAALLFAHSFPVFYNPEALSFTIDFYGMVSSLVPCDELAVVPNREIVDFILRNRP